MESFSFQHYNVIVFSPVELLWLVAVKECLARSAQHIAHLCIIICIICILNSCDLKHSMLICQPSHNMSDSHQRITKVSMLGRIRRSFRRKKESYCINCGHVTKSCSHNRDVYENVEFGNKDDLLKWLDLDLSHGGINNNPALRLKYQV